MAGVTPAATDTSSAGGGGGTLIAAAGGGGSSIGGSPPFSCDATCNGHTCVSLLGGDSLWTCDSLFSVLGCECAGCECEGWAEKVDTSRLYLKCGQQGIDTHSCNW